MTVSPMPTVSGCPICWERGGGEKQGAHSVKGFGYYGVSGLQHPTYSAQPTPFDYTQLVCGNGHSWRLEWNIEAK